MTGVISPSGAESSGGSQVSTAGGGQKGMGLQLPKGLRMPSTQGYVGTAWLGPQVGVIALVVLSAFKNGAETAVVWGAIVWLVSWLVSGFAYARFSSPDKANGRNYGELTTRLAVVEARRKELCDSTPPAGQNYPPPANVLSACSQASEHLDWVKDQMKGSGEIRWVNGAGYIEAWQRLHRAEEALIGAEPPKDLLDEALHDELRLRDSAVTNRDTLLGILATVRQFLCDGTVDPSADPCIKTNEAATFALKEIRYSLNDFRDSSRNGLLQLRNQTMTTVLLTNITLFAFAAVAVAAGAQGPAMLAGTLFYLAGALIGIFSRLNQQFNSQAAVDDFGLTTARLLAIPVYSGLAGVTGVLITLLAGAATGSPGPALSAVFKIPPPTGLLVVAAAFGAAPDLVLSRLADAADAFKTGISSTEPANSA